MSYSDDLAILEYRRRTAVNLQPYQLITLYINNEARNATVTSVEHDKVWIRFLGQDKEEWYIVDEIKRLMEGVE
jgi:hypothetical protein